MVNWDHQDESEDGACPRTRDEADARLVCDQLDIDFHVVNFVKNYWNDVFINFLENYRNGLTVVPDVECNRLIKFDLLHRFAFDTLSADAVATGHFARTSQGDFLERPAGENEKVKLLRPRDSLKDQTYFLASLEQHQLRRVMFPIGSLTKTQVREIARSEGLNVAEKSESMGICFVGKKKDFSKFLNKYIEPVTGGQFVDVETGEAVFGLSHSGVHYFTLGKRLHISHEAVPNFEGLFVAGLDPQTQTVYFCHGSHHRLLYAKRIAISVPHWISGDSEQSSAFIRLSAAEPEKWPLSFSIQRTHFAVQCHLSRDSDGEFRLESRLPIRAAAQGQMCAFYSNDNAECLGCAKVIRVTETL